MGGETGQLQRLTDEQVSARLAAYNGDGSLDRDVKLLRDNVTDIISAEIVAQFGKERAERFAAHYEGSVDTKWIQAVADYGRQIYAEKISVPAYMVARTQAASRIAGRIIERYSEEFGQARAGPRGVPAARHLRDRHHPCAGFAPRGDRGRRPARPRERAVRAPRRRARAPQHRAVEGVDRAHALNLFIGARHARQDQRSRRRGRTIGRRDARGRADRRGPHPRDRGRPVGGRGRRRRCNPRRRPGQPGGESQPGAVRPRRSDRIDPRPHPRHRRPDQSPRAQRHDRGGPRRRCRPRLRGRRAGSEEPRLADCARDRRHHRQDHRDPAGDSRRRSRPTARSRAPSKRCKAPPTASARRWNCRRRR